MSTGCVLRYAVLAFALLAQLSCDSGSNCDKVLAPEQPAIILSVYDSQTGELLTEGVSGVAVVGDGVYQIEFADNGEYWIYGPPGDYEVFVAVSGYYAWYVQNVKVAMAGCFNRTVHIRADLVPRSEEHAQGSVSTDRR